MSPIEWLRRLFRDGRKRRRKIDAEILWPLLWERASSPIAFILAASEHTAIDRAWSHVDEWSGTDEDPGVWAARRVNAARREAKP